MPTTQKLQDFTQQVRRDILRMVHAVNSGHPGGSLGCAEFITCLYQEVMEYSTEFDMDGKNVKIGKFMEIYQEECLQVEDHIELTKSFQEIPI